MRFHPIRDEFLHIGPGEKDRFEGWYFRLTDARGQNPLAVIPGISTARGDAHAFCMALDGSSGKSARTRFALDDFSACSRPFGLSVGASSFSLHGLSLDLDGEIPLKGAITFSGRRPWRGTPLNPRAMGSFGWLPFLQCYHGVLSFSHSLEGSLEIAGRRVDYSGGRGYAEKDWGSSFPSSWIWSQSAHFTDPRASAMVSVATVPLLGSSFRGFIFALDCSAGFFRLATWSGARIASLSLSGDGAEILIRQGSLEAAIGLGAGKGRIEPLIFPADKGLMSGQIKESLDAELSISLRRRSGAAWTTLWEDRGRMAGLELGPAVESLADPR